MSKNISILNHQIKNQGQILDSDVTEAIQDVSNDEMVYGIKLKLQEVTTESSGKYSCVIANHYGVLTKSINIEVGE